MNQKTLQTLEYHKILTRLAGYTAFAVSAEKAQSLRPTSDIEEARKRLAETSEAVQLLATQTNLTIGGARDIRAAVDLAVRGGVLTTLDLMDIKSTLIASRTLSRTFERLGETCPLLADLAGQIPPSLGLIDAITHTISERGEVLDSASVKLGQIRRDLRIAHDRLLTKMQHLVSDPKMIPLLQEPLVTQRDGRYVLPLRAEFKGRIKSIVHDQSSSGATLFVEPFSVVDLNNQNRELQLAERDEERRVLAELSNQVGEYEFEINQAVEVIARLDLIFACAKYADDLDASKPVLHPFPKQTQPVDKQGSHHPGSLIRLYGARHPLLDPEQVVPIDMELDSQTYAMVITGPNTGGKTVSLKTVGLLTLMALSGMHIPVEVGSEISAFEEVYADIGDEQSIEQSLSTFSSHITNIIDILEQADRHDLVLLDELGAGTDPQEGAALARALLSHLLERGITTLVATHYPELKAFAHTQAGVVNASVEFDLETLQPTYHLTVGLPGRSNALAIASRLGLPESIIEQARAGINPEDLRAEDLLDEIHRQRDAARQARVAAEQTRHEIESLRVELADRLEKLEDERREVLEQARVESRELVEQLQDEIREVRSALARARQPLEALKAIEEQAEDLEEEVETPVERQTRSPSTFPLDRPVRLGDRVRLRSLNTQGVVTSLSEEEAEVRVGMLRVRARLAEIEPVSGLSETAELPTPSISDQSFSPAGHPGVGLAASPGIELDLRGQRIDEALQALDRYLEAAYLAGLPFVRIIHGKGTGRLRQAVRQALPGHPHVKSFEPGGEKEGGDGVTVVKLEGN